MILFVFDAGQGLSEHTSPFEGLALLLDGLVTLTIGGASCARPLVRSRDAGERPAPLNASEPGRLLLIMLRENATK